MKVRDTARYLLDLGNRLNGDDPPESIPLEEAKKLVNVAGNLFVLLMQERVASTTMEELFMAAAEESLRRHT